ncbi:MAG: NifU N-terminal domain-containing protein [Acidimicrobiia bacterium]|nr:NifU N-terminal domain-containing protein [Acidimicrobiia bacterium]
MTIRVDPTPNPNALKFTVGMAVGGPVSFPAGKPTDDPMAQALLAIDGVTNVFLTADFVTLSKSPAGSWESIQPAAIEILEEHYG